MATDIATVRLHGGKNVLKSSVFEDSDIQVFIDTTDSLRGAAAAALTSLAGDSAALAVLIESLNFKQDSRSKAKELRATAAALINTENSQPATATAEIGRGQMARDNILDAEWARAGFGNTE